MEIETESENSSASLQAHQQMVDRERTEAGPGAGAQQPQPPGQVVQPGASPVPPIDPEKARKGIQATIRIIDRLICGKLERNALRILGNIEDAAELRADNQIQPDEEEAAVELGCEVLAQFEWLARYSPLLLSAGIAGGYAWRVSGAFDDLAKLEAKKKNPDDKKAEPAKPGPTAAEFLKSLNDDQFRALCLAMEQRAKEMKEQVPA